VLVEVLSTVSKKSNPQKRKIFISTTKRQNTKKNHFWFQFITKKTLSWTLDWVSSTVYDLCHRYVSSTLHCEVDESHTHYTDITKYYKKVMTIFGMPCLPTTWLTCNVVQKKKKGHSQWKSNVQSFRVCTSPFTLIYFTFSFTGFLVEFLSHNVP